MITGIRGLCNGIGPALFGFVFYVFHVDLEEGEGQTVHVTTSSNHTTMQDPYGKVLKIKGPQSLKKIIQYITVETRFFESSGEMQNSSK